MKSFLPGSTTSPVIPIGKLDMRHLDHTDAHYHTGDETEIYIVLSGTGTVYLRDEGREVQPGDAVIIAPGTAHFTIPKADLVLAVINTPPFKAENYQTLTESNSEVGFDADNYAKFTATN